MAEEAAGQAKREMSKVQEAMAVARPAKKEAFLEIPEEGLPLIWLIFFKTWPIA
jgi:hypothetical protein